MTDHEPQENSVNEKVVEGKKKKKSDSTRNLNEQDKYGRTKLIRASGGYDSDDEEKILRLLKDPDVDVNVQTHHGHTALMKAAKNNRLVQAKQLANCARTELNHINLNGHSAIMLAAKAGYLNCVGVLLEEKNIDVNLKDLNGMTALHLAAEAGHIGCVQMLLDCSFVDITAKIYEGKSAHDCAENEAIKSLIRAKSYTWLAARLDGLDAAIVRAIETKLVKEEQLVTEADFANCPPDVFNRSFLDAKGIVAIGAQNRLLNLHRELRQVHQYL